MKTLEQLGYNIYTNHNAIIVYRKNDYYIFFDYSQKTFLADWGDQSMQIDMETLQAINLKCKELDWI